MTKKIFTIFGSAAAEEADNLYQTARAIGRSVAEFGWTVCNGGYGGTMEATARGAIEAGGHTIGVTCARFERSGPNRYIKQEIPTFDLLQRLNTLIQLGRAYLVLPGGTGTLAELALVWEMKNKRLLAGERPLAIWGEHWNPVINGLIEVPPDIAEIVKVSDIDGLQVLLRRLDI